MKNNSDRVNEYPHIYTKNHIVYKVSDSFLQITGYKDHEIIGKSLMDVGRLLKSGHQLSIQDIKEKEYVYIFTSSNLPIEVKVSANASGDEDSKVYYFEQMRNPALQFTLDNFASTATNKNGSVAVYSYPEGILLQHDENYIDTLFQMGHISNDPIGKPPLLAAAILDLFKQGITLHEFEVESQGVNETATYWDVNIKIISGIRDTTYVVASFYNVTEKANERKVFMKQRIGMELILENMSDVVNVLDKDGNYIYVNKVGREALSPYIPEVITDIETVSSKKANEAFGLSDINGKRIAFEDTPDQRVLRGETVINDSVIGTSKLPTSYYMCNGIPLYDKQGNIDGGILLYQNVEIMYKIEEYKAVQENIEVAYVYFASFSHEDYKISYINDFAYQSIKGIFEHVTNELDVIGVSIFEFYGASEKEVVIEGIKEAMKNHTSYIHKHEFMSKGETKYTKNSFQPIYNKNNEVEKIIAVGIDITDEETANQKMEMLLTAQEEIFINTSHELKTPLSVIFSGAQLIDLYLKNDTLNEHKMEILNVIKTTTGNCYRLTKLINNILDISKIESGLYELDLHNYNIVGIMDEIVESVAEYTKTKGIHIIFDPDVEELIMALDVHKFDRILLNLISNAIKFSVAGQVILIKLAVHDHHVRISITDQGIGIDQKNFDEIFKKFIQLNRNLNRLSEGTGLGLPLARSMAELHGGSLKVESVLGKGSIFTLEIPIKVLNGTSRVQEYSNSIDRVEIIKYEFSDIYF